MNRTRAPRAKEAPRRPSFSWPRLVPSLYWIAPVVAGGLLRLAALAATGELECTHDECSYLRLGRVWATGGGLVPHRGFVFAPGYPFFLAACWRLFDDPVWSAKILQVALSTSTIGLAMDLGRRLTTAGNARVAGWLLALHPTLIGFSHLLWSETLYLALLTAAFGLVLRRAEGHREIQGGRMIAAGLVFGAAALVRPIAIYSAGLVALWLLYPRRLLRPRWREALLLALGVAAVVLPWSATSVSRHGRFYLIDTTTGANLWRGNGTEEPANWDFGMERRPSITHVGYPACQQDNPVDRDRCNRWEAAKQIAAHPARAVARAPTKLLDLLAPTSFVVRHARWGLYGNVSGASIAALTAMTLVAHLLWAFGFLGVGSALSAAAPIEARENSILIGLMVVLTLAVHTITFGMSRFLLPLLPLLAPSAAAALCSPRQTARSSGRFGLAVALALIGLLGAAAWFRIEPLMDLEPAVVGRPAPMAFGADQ